MIAYLNLFKVEMKKSFWEMKRYYFNTIIGLIVMYMIFLGMFYGLKTFGGSSVTQDSLDGMVIGFCLWTFAITAFQGIGGIVLEESQKGTLEQLYLSPLGSEIIFFSKIISNIFFSAFFVTIMLFMMMISTGKILSINFFHFYSITIISILSLVGLGFIMGGLALIHKKISSINQIITFALAGLLLLDTYPLNIFSFLPYAAGAHTVNAAIVKGEIFPLSWYLFILGNSLIYLIGGLFIYQLLAKKARKLNKLGQY